MISSTDVPACSACGCREVHPVTRVPDRNIVEKLSDDIAGKEPALETFYACRNCGRDVTDAWEAIQPAPLAVAVIGVDLAGDEPDRTEKTVVDAHRLGIAATVNGSQK